MEAYGKTFETRGFQRYYEPSRICQEDRDIVDDSKLFLTVMRADGY